MLVVAVLSMGAVGTVAAQQMVGGQSGGANGSGSVAAAGGSAAGGGTGAGPSATPGVTSGTTPGVGTSVNPTYGGNSSSSGPALNNMRANGTALYMNPDPRAPNVTGRPAPTR
ncbi:hypothetical protein [Paraburkholderia antibiotica]|nr:hypothetical protein [Paraburkholderia antibiotica]